MKAIIASTIGVVSLLYYMFPFVNISGESMTPTYKDGEVLLSYRLFSARHLKKGDVVVFNLKDSENVSKRVIKRIHYIKSDKHGKSFYILGDNTKCSYDSRYYGFVSDKCVVCKLFSQRPNN